MKRRLLYYICTFLMIGGMWSCSDDDSSWQPGPAVKEGCQQVHFAGNNPSVAFASAEGLKLVVKRNTTSGQLTVPVNIISADEGLQIPQSVNFADGENTANLVIQVPATAASGDSYNFELRLEGDEIDPYANLDGTSYFKGLISFARNRRAQFYINGYTDKLGWWGEDVLELTPQDYVITNFCRSGFGLRITVDDENYVSVMPYGFEPYDYTTDYGYVFYLTYHEELGYLEFNPWDDDFPVNITTMTIYNGSGTYRGYGRYYPASDRFLITLGSIQTSDQNASSSYVSMYMKLAPEGEEPTIYKPSTSSEPE